jgi:hypothetical protein
MPMHAAIKFTQLLTFARFCFIDSSATMPPIVSLLVSKCPERNPCNFETGHNTINAICTDIFLKQIVQRSPRFTVG